MSSASPPSETKLCEHPNSMDSVTESTPDVPVKKKRGRKPKNAVCDPSQPTADQPVRVAKKRGRKPKGGKIVSTDDVSIDPLKYSQHVILQLKCSVDDLNTPIMDNGNDNDYNTDPFSTVFPSCDSTLLLYPLNQDSEVPLKFVNDFDADTTITDMDFTAPHHLNTKQIWKNIKHLQKQFHYNDLYSQKNSACFWCTYDFSNPSIHIPSSFINDIYQVYGNFCSPECGVAFLMNEHIDSSQKFERIQMMNYMYGRIYNYTKNIKPAPNPFFLLDKYYGNLTIQEYRKCFDTDRLLLVVDKPITKLMPELHDESDNITEVNSNALTNNSSIYQVKRKSTSTKSKSEIISDNFGFTS